MPGFNIITGGKGKTINFKPIYTYTWSVKSIFGETVEGDERYSDIMIRDCTLPTFTVKREEKQGAFLNYKFASGVDWQDIKITFYDIAFFFETIQKWRGSIISGTKGNVTLMTADNYKKESTIQVLYSYDQPAYKWVMCNSWPSEIRSGELTYTASDAKIVDVTLTYDWAYEEGANY